MIIRNLRPVPRGGAAALETARVMILVATFFFGVFEYSRFVMDLNLLNNAAREGRRYALVNNTSTTVTSDVQTTVTNYMAGRNTAFTGFSVTVSGTQQGTSTPVNNLVPGDLITVKVSGTYKFLNIIPFNPMPSSLSVSGSVTLACEGIT
jgi:Flp pilus assembly protein TadG